MCGVWVGVWIPGGVGNFLGCVLTTAKLWNSLTEQSLQRTSGEFDAPGCYSSRLCSPFLHSRQSPYLWILGTISYNSLLSQMGPKDKEGRGFCPVFDAGGAGPGTFLQHCLPRWQLQNLLSHYQQLFFLAHLLGTSFLCLHIAHLLCTCGSHTAQT